MHLSPMSNFHPIRATRRMTTLCAVGSLILLLQGCAIFGSHRGDGALDDGELGEEAAVAAELAANAANGNKPAPNAGQQAAQQESEVEEPKKTGDAIPPSGRAATEPILQTGYRVRIAVMVGDEVEIDPTEVQISEECEITLPLIGKVSCAGLTINGLRSRLATRFGEFMRDPEVTVSFVITDNSLSPFGQVLVQGRVAQEGWVNIPPTRVLKLSRAIQLAGGFASSAKKSSVRVTRKDAAGKAVHYKVDVEAIGRNGDLDKDIALEPDDVIYVYESNF